MATKEPVQCSSCGSGDSVEVRHAACVATTSWIRNNYPAPNDYMKIRENIEFWQIALCKGCLPAAYQTYLRNSIKKSAKLLPFAVICMGISVPFFFFTPLKPILALLVTALFIMGLGSTLIFTLMIILEFLNLKILEQTGVVPGKQMEKSFIGEGQRIIKAIAPPEALSAKKAPAPKSGETPGKVWGLFPLPEHKSLDQLGLKAEQKEKIGTGFPDIDIEAVGMTIDEMKDKLPPEWKSLLKQ
jgi:hypothetical protein